MLYNFEGSTGLSARLHPAAHAQLSPEDVAIWQSELLSISMVWGLLDPALRAAAASKFRLCSYPMP